MRRNLLHLAQTDIATSYRSARRTVTITCYMEIAFRKATSAKAFSPRLLPSLHSGPSEQLAHMESSTVSVPIPAGTPAPPRAIPAPPPAHRYARSPILVARIGVGIVIRIIGIIILRWSCIGGEGKDGSQRDHRRDGAPQRAELDANDIATSTLSARRQPTYLYDILSKKVPEPAGENSCALQI